MMQQACFYRGKFERFETFENISNVNVRRTNQKRGKILTDRLQFHLIICVSCLLGPVCATFQNFEKYVTPRSDSKNSDGAKHTRDCLIHDQCLFAFVEQFVGHDEF